MIHDTVTEDEIAGEYHAIVVSLENFKNKLSITALLLLPLIDFESIISF